MPATIGSLPAIAVMFGCWLLLPAGAARLAVGLTLGLGAGIAVAAAQIGPRRTLDTLRTMRATTVSDVP